MPSHVNDHRTRYGLGTSIFAVCVRGKREVDRASSPKKHLFPSDRAEEHSDATVSPHWKKNPSITIRGARAAALGRTMSVIGRGTAFDCGDRLRT